MIRSFFSALTFLTRIPAPNLPLTSKDWQRGVNFYPLIGLIIGMLLAIASTLLREIFPVTLYAFLLVGIWIWITGGLHLDGWMDLADGFGSNRTRDQMLEIMKDSRVGAMGVIAAILLIAGKGLALYELIRMDLTFVLLCIPLYARFMLICAIKAFPYKKEGGLGKGLDHYLTTPLMIIHACVILTFTYFVLHVNGLILFLFIFLCSFLFIWYIFKKLSLLTGDCYGAIVEWTEAVGLFLAIAIWRLLG